MPDMYVHTGQRTRGMAKEKIEWKNVERYELRLPADFFKPIDDWRRKQEDLPSRAEAIRRLVELGLAAKTGSKTTRR